MQIIELQPDGANWAWGRNGEIRQPKFITVTRMGGLPDSPYNEVWLSVYANRKTLEEGRSPIDLHLSPRNMRALADAIVKELGGLEIVSTDYLEAITDGDGVPL